MPVDSGTQVMRVPICAQHSYDSCMRYLVLDVKTSEEALAVSFKQYKRPRRGLCGDWDLDLAGGSATWESLVLPNLSSFLSIGPHDYKLWLVALYGAGSGPVER
jgi:hypothetical protein